MAVELPIQFLRWNYFSRLEAIKELSERELPEDMNLFLLDSTRHNPALCTACAKPDGSIYVNAKIVGMGYVLRKQFLRDATEDLSRHIEWGDKIIAESRTDEQKRVALSRYQRGGLLLLLQHLYLEPEEAMRRVDFTKMSTIELAKSRRQSSKHTWSIVQGNRTACLVFYRPPSVSFEVHGWLDVQEKGEYFDFVNAVHDVFHYVSPERRGMERPVYILNVEEVYDNSPTLEGFGKRIA